MFNYKPQTKSKPILIIEESSLYYKCLVEHIPNREIRLRIVYTIYTIWVKTTTCCIRALRGAVSNGMNHDALLEKPWLTLGCS